MSAEGRAQIPDLWRSFAVIAMIVYHFIYDLEYYHIVGEGTAELTVMLVLRYFTSASFIIISGICTAYSKDNIQRGFRILITALCVTVVTTILGFGISFGILHFIGTASSLYGVYRRKKKLSGSILIPIIFLFMFGVSAAALSRIRLDINFLSFIGLRGKEYSSLDYYPLLPWSFLYLSAAWFGENCKAVLSKQVIKEEKHLRILSFPGRHSLTVYLVHQPVLMTALFVYTRIIC